jgi:hypothetical protein
MAIRETLNKPIVGIIVAVAMVLVAVGVYLAFRQHNTAEGTMLNYTTDDGKTFFRAAAQGAPFESGGKTAYQVALFKCGDGAPFVGYLIRYTDAARDQVTNAYRNRIQLPMSGMEVRRPGDTDWVASSTIPTAPGPSTAGTGALAIKSVKCPDGSSATQLLTPQ